MSEEKDDKLMEQLIDEIDSHISKCMCDGFSCDECIAVWRNLRTAATALIKIVSGSPRSKVLAKNVINKMLKEYKEAEDTNVW